MESSYKRIGDYIQQVDVRNSDSSITELIGVSISKNFMESVANTIGTDLSKYKVISKGQFACSLMQVSRDGGIAISLYKEETSAIMSPAYFIFEVSSKELLAEYLELVVYNPTFDREAVFNAIGGVRGTLSWEEFCDMKINIPPLEEQQKIVRQYKTITDRIGVLEKINEELIKTATAVLKNKLEASERYIPFEETIELFDSKRKPLSGPVRDAMKNKIYPYYGAADLMDYVDNYIFDDIYGLIAEDGSVSNDKGNPTLQYVWGKFWVNNHAHIFQGSNGYTTELVYLLLKDIDIREIVTGAVQLKINQENLRAMPFHVPNEEDIESLNEISQKVFTNIRANRDEIKNLKIIVEHILKSIS